jgi:hypothetical protein
VTTRRENTQPTAVTDSDALAGLRRPEYTGENRCTPCTVVNLLLAGTGALGLAQVAGPALGAGAFAAGALVVYLRGYLVPGTPALTRRYFPPWLLRAFGKTPVASGSDSVQRDTDAPAAPTGGESPLASGGVVRAGNSTVPTDAFRGDWHARMAERSGVDEGDVAAAFDADAARRLGEASFDLDGTASLRWGSPAALLADVAAAGLLADRVDAWSGWDRDTRREVLMGLRLCLDVCPDCGGSVRTDEDRVDPCCQRPHLVAEAVCADCGAVLADTAVADGDDRTSVRETLLERRFD